MNRQQEQQIIDHLNQINNNIRGIEPHIGSIDDISKHLKNARFEIIHVIDLLKRYNRKNGKEKTI